MIKVTIQADDGHDFRDATVVVNSLDEAVAKFKKQYSGDWISVLIINHEPYEGLERNSSYNSREIQKIIEPHSKYCWITCIIANRWVLAKVFDEPSLYGINEGRVSKLCIGKTSERDSSKIFLDQMCYNYDRGLDFSELSDEDLNVIVETLEKLPKVFV